MKFLILILLVAFTAMAMCQRDPPRAPAPTIAQVVVTLDEDTSWALARAALSL